MAKNERKPINLLFCTPDYCGCNGSSVNERQLIESVSRRVNAVYVINLLDPTLLRPAYRKKLHLKSSRSNIKLINIPLLPPVTEHLVILYTFRLLVYNLLFLWMATLMKKFKLVNCIYVRNPEYAFAFSVFKKFIGSFAVKFAGFHTQEALEAMKGNLQRWFFVSFFERINYRVLNSADLLLVHSSYYKTELKNRYQLNDNRSILVVPPGIDLQKINRVREKTERKASELNIGIVGSASWWDGSNTLLESVPAILKSYPSLNVNFVFGSGDGNVLRHLKTRARELKIENVYFKGPLTHEEALGEMCQLSALVLPRRRTLSTELTIPLKVLESLALGVPVVVTRHKVFEETFTDFFDIIYIEPNARDVAEKVVLLLSNSDLAQQVSKNGIKLASQMSYDKTSEKLADALSKI
jgi:glycosyltransferase involved in cell wall biosynthesis